MQKTTVLDALEKINKDLTEDIMYNRKISFKDVEVNTIVDTAEHELERANEYIDRYNDLEEAYNELYEKYQALQAYFNKKEQQLGTLFDVIDKLIDINKASCCEDSRIE